MEKASTEVSSENCAWVRQGAPGRAATQCVLEGWGIFQKTGARVTLVRSRQKVSATKVAILCNRSAIVCNWFGVVAPARRFLAKTRANLTTDERGLRAGVANTDFLNRRERRERRGKGGSHTSHLKFQRRVKKFFQENLRLGHTRHQPKSHAGSDRRE